MISLQKRINVMIPIYEEIIECFISPGYYNILAGRMSFGGYRSNWATWHRNLKDSLEKLPGTWNGGLTE